ncbi:MAG TPA: HDOD domain-containing protein, partial [Oligoflexia bacterium]|nr:HDOD domain-containing protein [Oligoflexia bacterium]
MPIMSTEESLERALEHVSQGWLPAQRSVLERIQHQLEAGDYNNDRPKLLRDLKEDFSLYLYCLKELSVMLNQHAQAPEQNWRLTENGAPPKQTPVEILHNSELDAIRRVLGKSAADISQHVFDEMNDFQALRLRESMLSASTAEILAESVQVDSEVAFSCGLLRQLGLALISWNYPRVYARAMETLTAETTLDALLKRALGFSPSLLGLAFARRWNLSDDVLIALGDRKAQIAARKPFGPEQEKDKLNNTPDSVGATLAKICEVGEALARANDPQHYPTALADWQTAQEVIASHLGPRGIAAIYSRTQEYLREYSRRVPEVAEFVDAEAARETISGAHYSSKLL